jgi:hypothetical protein
MNGMALSLSKIANRSNESFMSPLTDIRRGKRTSLSRKQHTLRRKKIPLLGVEARLYGRMRKN